MPRRFATLAETNFPPQQAGFYYLEFSRSVSRHPFLRQSLKALANQFDCPSTFERPLGRRRMLWLALKFLIRAGEAQRRRVGRGKPYGDEK